jgi:D-lactate dehydrogenase
MLFFDYRNSEKDFFKKNKFDNFEIKFFEESLNEDNLKLLSEDDFEHTMIISVFINSNVNSKIISRFKNLRVLTTRSTGYDHIDLNSCLKKNIALLNVEAYGSISVAQFTFAMILMLVRNLFLAITTQKNKIISSTNLTGRNLNDLTIGIVGTGEVGAGVCKLAHGFGMRILAYDMRQKKELEEKYDVEYVNFDTLLKNSDIITLHIPYTKENYHLFSKKQFELMKDDAYFINVARGELVDNDALLENVKSGKFKGVALDVIACHQDNKSSKTKSSLYCIETSKAVQELALMPNVLMTPHMAYDTKEAVEYILNATFEGLSDYLKGGRNHRVL